MKKIFNQWEDGGGGGVKGIRRSNRSVTRILVEEFHDRFIKMVIMPIIL